jgi:Xaa-Pro aminopeptidase
MTNNVYSSRLARLRQSLASHQAFFLTNPTDITYFAGFQSLVPEEREGFLLLTSQKSYLFHASFSPVPSSTELILLPGTSVNALLKYFKELQQTMSLTELLVDKTKLFADEYEGLQQLENCTLTSLDHAPIWSQRMVKDTSEIEIIRTASQIARDAIATIQPLLQVGMTELDVQHLLEIEMIKLGSEKVAFPSIVCFGDHAALPHHQPTKTQLTMDTPVLIDFGATVAGYRSDMTRTFWFGDQPSQNFSKIEIIIKAAYQASLSLLQHPPATTVTAAALDKAARALITEAGYGRQFIHTTGHGVGLDIHEQPSLNWSNSTELKSGMVVTIEPGIYLEGELGYRHENTVLITATGVEELTL